MDGKRVRVGGLMVAVGIAAAVNVSGPFDRDPPLSTDVGSAVVDLGEDTARRVERVTYRQDVERVGDILVVDGTPIREPTGELAAVWEIVDATWPSGVRDDLAQVSVVREEERGLVGVVHASVTGGWVLSLDIADLDDRALIEETIVHELSHVVTLDAAVFDFGAVDKCRGTAISLGCAAEGSILAAFAERFWSDDAGADIRHPHEHVNEYAATAPHEDLAETFTAWVLGWPIESEVVEAKIEMLADDEELAELAAALRARLVDARQEETGGGSAGG